MRFRNWLRRGEAGAVGGTRRLSAVRPFVPTAWVSTRAGALALTGIAVGVAWAGQAITTRDLPGALGPLGFLARLFSAYRNDSEISAALILLVLGAVLMGFASLRLPAVDDQTPMLAQTRPLGGWLQMSIFLRAAVIAGVLLWAQFLRVLYDKDYQHPVNFLLLAALLLVAVPLVKRDVVERRLRLRLSRWLPLHLAFVAAIFCSFLYLNARDLGNWRYSAVGDEYNNFYFALSIAKGALHVNPWSHRGADDLFSVMGAMGQALFLRLGNEDNFAWKFFSVFMAATSFIPFYFLIRELFKTRIAIMATAMFASSHYIFGYAHHFLYLDGMLPTTLGLWLLVVGLKRDSSLALFASGLALALGFYTFESGRAAVVVVAVFMLTFGLRAFRPAVFLPLAGGFILLALPLFAADGPYHVFDQMFGQSAVSYSSSVTGDRWHRLLVNAQYSFVSFNYMNTGRHYVWGSLADPLTAMLFVLGLGVVAVRIKRPAYRLVLIWWIVEVAFNGFTNPYPQPPISRMHAVVPVVAVLAALAVDAIARPLTNRSPWRRLIDDRRWNIAAGSLVMVLLLPAILYLNLYRFWYQLPRRFGTPTDETVVVRAYELPQCRGKDVLIVARDPLSLLDKVFRSYNTQPMPRFYYYPVAIDALREEDPNVSTATPAIGQPDCIIVQPSSNPADTHTVMDEAPRRFPDYRLTALTDYSGLRQAYLFTPASAGEIPSAP